MYQVIVKKKNQSLASIVWESYQDFAQLPAIITAFEKIEKVKQRRNKKEVNY